MFPQQRPTAPVIRRCVKGRSHGAPVAVVVTSIPGRLDVATWWCQSCMDRLDLRACEALMPTGSTVSLRSVGPASWRLAHLVRA